MRAFVTFLLLGVALKAFPQVGRAEYYFDDASLDYSQGISLTVPVNTGDVEITGEISASALSPGFHQVFFRVRDNVKGWSQAVSRIFLKSWPLEAVAGFRYRIDAKTGAEAWTYRAFPAPLTDVTMDLELNASTIPDGIHYLEASARSANGIWSHISTGTFFSYSFATPNIKALEYYFEDESGGTGPLLTVNNFTPSRNLTLDSVTFSIPVSSLVNLKKYFIYVRAVDESGNRGFYMKDTIVYHAITTGIRDRIFLSPELMVFPNPASGMVNIKLVTLDHQGDLFIRIFDETGRIVNEEKFSFIENDHFSVDASTLVAGVYRIVIYSASGRTVARATFVKK